MMGEAALWGPAILALASGLLGAAWLVSSLRGRKESDAPSSTAMVDLEERAGHAIALLRDLEEQKGRIDPATYAADKSRLEAVAAEALRRRDRELLELAERRPLPEAAPARGVSPQLKGFLWGVGTVGIGVMLVVMAQNASRPRAEGETMTGNSGGAMQPGGPSFTPDAEMQALALRLKDDPDDVEALVRLAHKLLQAQALREAQMVNRRALELAPSNAEAKVHDAVLKSATGDVDGALADLDSLLEREPALAEGWFFRGMIGMSNGKADLAKESWARYVAVAPEGPQKERIRGFLEGKGLQMPSRP